MASRQAYLRQLIPQLDVALPEHRTTLGDLLSARARGIAEALPAGAGLGGGRPGGAMRWCTPGV